MTNQSKYNGLVFLTASGASGDFFTVFTKTCFEEKQVSINKYVKESNEDIKHFINVTKPSLINISWVNWKNINNIRNINLDNFNGNGDSAMNMHIPDHCNETDKRYMYLMYLNLLQDMMNKNIKLYYIDLMDERIAGFAFYTSRTVRLYHEIEKCKKYPYHFKSEVYRFLFMQEYMLDAYKKHDIIVEKINLADLVYNRDFDKLYDQIKESYNLKSRFSNENKQIVNDIWDKRIENLKNLGWW